MTRNGKDGCVGCHQDKKIVTALRLTGNLDKDFRIVLREGFLLKDDPGSLLGRVTDRDLKRRAVNFRRGDVNKAGNFLIARGQQELQSSFGIHFMIFAG